MVYTYNIDEGIFDFKQYEKAVYRLSVPWTDSNRKDLIVYNEEGGVIEMDTSI